MSTVVIIAFAVQTVASVFMLGTGLNILKNQIVNE